MKKHRTFNQHAARYRLQVITSGEPREPREHSHSAKQKD